jgi:hypothetical protein
MALVGAGVVLAAVRGSSHVRIGTDAARLTAAVVVATAVVLGVLRWSLPKKIERVERRDLRLARECSASSSSMLTLALGDRSREDRGQRVRRGRGLPRSPAGAVRRAPSSCSTLAAGAAVARGRARLVGDPKGLLIDAPQAGPPRHLVVRAQRRGVRVALWSLKLAA